MISATWLIVAFFVGAILALAVQKRNHYWEGRSAGWTACEQMVIERAKKHNYPAKVLEDLIQ